MKAGPEIGDAVGGLLMSADYCFTYYLNSVYVYNKIFNKWRYKKRPANVIVIFYNERDQWDMTVGREEWCHTVKNWAS